MGSVKEHQKESTDHLVKIIREYNCGMLCTRTRDGQLRSRPMAIARVDDDGDVWFATSIDTPKVRDLRLILAGTASSHAPTPPATR